MLYGYICLGQLPNFSSGRMKMLQLKILPSETEVAFVSSKEKKMKIGLVIYSNDPETVWNAFRLGNFALKEGDAVKTFLLAKGMESESLDTEQFKITVSCSPLLRKGAGSSPAAPVSRFANPKVQKFVPYPQ